MKRYFFEIFADFENLKTRDERKVFLKSIENQTLLMMLKAAFNPRIKFFLIKVPAKYKPNMSMPLGMADYTMEQVFNKIYLFEPGHPRDPKITYEKREQLLVQFLEGMPEKEAKILLDVMLKSLDVKYLTASLVREVWPGLLPVTLDVPAKKEQTTTG